MIERSKVLCGGGEQGVYRMGVCKTGIEMMTRPMTNQVTTRQAIALGSEDETARRGQKMRWVEVVTFLRNRSLKT
jgi:hypothetical protein